MSPRIVGLLALVLLLCLPSAAGAGGHYVPRSGDRFYYYETIVLNDGTGYDYSGYTENTYLNGTVGVTGVLPNGTESASFENAWSWSNNTGSHETGGASGNFTFSANSFLYVKGTDNQTGYTNPYVWFYMNNSFSPGDTFYLLNTEMSVVSRDYAYDLPGTGYVATIEARGTGSYERDDAYGIFNATYTWQSYFDPATGYIVGYLYTEHDLNSSTGDGFTWTDTLYVTGTTYALTPAQAPPPSTPFPWALVIGLVVFLLIIVLVIWLVLRSRNRPKRLPQHAAPGNIGYGVPPPPPFAAMGGPPPINLTPPGQPVPQVVLRETVKVKCRYCGNLIDVTDKVCPFCGAPQG